MGVPGLFKHFSKKYPDSLIKTLPKIDFMYIDFNGIVHRSYNPTYTLAAKDDNEIFLNISTYLENIYSLVQPKKLIYISTDGVAPRAKINQQRSRRYQSSLEKTNLIEEKLNFVKKELKDETNFEEEICKEEKEKPLVFNLNEESKLEIDEISEEFIFETNNITPGTEFMDKLDTFMISFIQYKISKDWKNLTVIYSSSKVPGEGEQKIMDFIRKQKNFENFNHLIYSPDADLIFLSLLIPTNIILMRNDHGFEEKQKKIFCAKCETFGHMDYYCGSIEMLKYFYLSVNTIKEHIFDFFERYVKREYEPTRLLADFVFAASFLGNDFVPTLPCLDVSFNGVNNVFFILTYTYNSTGKYLTEGSEMNFFAVKCFLKNLAKHEDIYYLKKLENLRKTRLRFSSILPENETIQEEIIVKEDSLAKDDSLAKEMENEAERLTQTEILPFFEEIYLHTEAGKSTYYTQKLKIKSSKEVEDLCVTYLKQIYWVFRYYLEGFTCWEYYFPYLYAPIASDLANLKEFEVKFENNSPLSPLEQLVCVSPPACLEYLPKEFSQIHKEFPQFYPKVVHFDMFDKAMPYQAVGLLPFLDLKILLPRIAELLENASPETLWLNIFDSPKIFVNSESHGGKRIFNMYKTLKPHFNYETEDLKIVVKPFSEANFDKKIIFNGETFQNNCVCGNIESGGGKFLKKN
ncbi:5-3 exoribonuclease [Tubulinosema ratisbonensis]|uniref:5-3 exoribonuclease n=1 Tax=Tubulinosema ratisbonensis TaxID=291195 RepID=A0A437AME5_9MICR|nr:5-3 exoribonuclease [Tubulinosema ratisbonensis]